jgi:hypothetical protein
LLLAHVPPAAASFNVVVEPSQTTAVPPIAAGRELTVTTAAVAQPVDNIYDIVAVPAITPVTTPLDVPTVALPLLLLQVPPALLVRLVVDPAQTDRVPLITDGSAFTVTTTVATSLPHILVEV